MSPRWNRCDICGASFPPDKRQQWITHVNEHTRGDES